jgi:ribonuclease P protein component
MLKKVNRLAKDKDIQITFTRGRAFFNHFFTIKFLSSQTENKFAVVVSTKVFKKANQRNRLKRLIRECLRKRMLELKKGRYMIMAKSKVAALPEEKRIPAFLEVLNKIR